MKRTQPQSKEQRNARRTTLPDSFPGQKIIIDPDGLNIVVEVIEVRGNKTRLAFLANPDTKIYREELLSASVRRAPDDPDHSYTRRGTCPGSLAGTAGNPRGFWRAARA